MKRGNARERQVTRQQPSGARVIPKKGGADSVVRNKRSGQFRTVVHGRGDYVTAVCRGARQEGYTVQNAPGRKAPPHDAPAQVRPVLLFKVAESDGWLVARCRNPEMATQAKTANALKQMVKDLVACHFDNTDPRHASSIVFQATPGVAFA